MDVRSDHSRVTRQSGAGSGARRFAAARWTGRKLPTSRRPAGGAGHWNCSPLDKHRGFHFRHHLAPLINAWLIRATAFGGIDLAQCAGGLTWPADDRDSESARNHSGCRLHGVGWSMDGPSPLISGCHVALQQLRLATDRIHRSHRHPLGAIVFAGYPDNETRYVVLLGKRMASQTITQSEYATGAATAVHSSAGTLERGRVADPPRCHRLVRRFHETTHIMGTAVTAWRLSAALVGYEQFHGIDGTS